MQDGVYEAVFAPPATMGRAVLVLNQGKLVGLGLFSGRYDGKYSRHADRQQTRLDISVNIPSSESVIADSPDRASATSFTLLCSPMDRQLQQETEIAGASVSLQLRRITTFAPSGDRHSPSHAERIGDGLYRMVCLFTSLSPE